MSRPSHATRPPLLMMRYRASRYVSACIDAHPRSFYALPAFGLLEGVVYLSTCAFAS